MPTFFACLAAMVAMLSTSVWGNKKERGEFLQILPKKLQSIWLVFSLNEEKKEGAFCVALGRSYFLLLAKVASIYMIE